MLCRYNSYPLPVAPIKYQLFQAKKVGELFSSKDRHCTSAQFGITYSKIDCMGFDQYHEPPSELPSEVRTFARMIRSLIEEAEAIDWYEQRIAVEQNEEARKIMQNTQKEEFIHFAMDLEFLLRRKEQWRTILRNVLFKAGDIVENGEKAEEKAE